MNVIVNVIVNVIAPVIVIDRRDRGRARERERKRRRDRRRQRRVGWVQTGHMGGTCESAPPAGRLAHGVDHDHGVVPVPERGHDHDLSITTMGPITITGPVSYTHLTLPTILRV